MSYYESTSGNLIFAFRPEDGDFSTEVADDSGNVGSFGSVGLGLGEKPEIVYRDNDQQLLKHARRNGPGDFDFAYVVPNFESQSESSFAIDTAGGSHLSFSSNVKLYYAFRDASEPQFSVTLVSDQVVASGSVEVDTMGAVHISYPSIDENSDLYYAFKPAGGTFSTSMVDDAGSRQTGSVGQFSSLVVDSHLQVHIVYYDSILRLLKYAWGDNNQGFANAVIDNGGVFSVMALDSNDGLHVVHWSTDNGLRYGYRLPPRPWVWTTVEPELPFSHVLETTLAVSDAGRVHLMYRDERVSKLIYTVGCR